MTDVVWICSPSTETMAKGSGTRRMSRLIKESAATTAGMSEAEQGSASIRASMMIESDGKEDGVVSKLSLSCRQERLGLTGDSHFARPVLVGIEGRVNVHCVRVHDGVVDQMYRRRRDERGKEEG